MHESKILRLKELMNYSGLNISQFAKRIDIDQSNLSSILNGKRPFGDGVLNKMIISFDSINKDWLLTGEGEMLKSEVKTTSTSKGIEGYEVPLLPIYTHGGRLDKFTMSIKDADCEKIISPIEGADFAITVSGNSMAPEYPSGSKIIIKKINEKSFIEWGRCYVLDTCNGVVVKKLVAPTEEDPKFGYDYVTCISVNQDPIYTSFRVPTKDIYGMYRVLMQLTEK